MKSCGVSIRQNLFGGNSHGTIYLLMQFHLLSLWMKSFGATIQMKPLQQVLSHAVFNVVLTFEIVDKILLCDHSNETSSAVLSGAIYLVCSSNFYVCG